MIFWILTGSCITVYCAVLPFNNIASGFIVEKWLGHDKPNPVGAADPGMGKLYTGRLNCVGAAERCMGPLGVCVCVVVIVLVCAGAWRGAAADQTREGQDEQPGQLHHACHLPDRGRGVTNHGRGYRPHRPAVRAPLGRGEGGGVCHDGSRHQERWVTGAVHSCLRVQLCVDVR
jgi:hypothetical protein